MITLIRTLLYEPVLAYGVIASGFSAALVAVEPAPVWLKITAPIVTAVGAPITRRFTRSKQSIGEAQ